MFLSGVHCVSCGDVELEAGTGTEVKRLAGRRGRKVDRSTGDDRERSQDCEQKESKRKPREDREQQGKADRRKADTENLRGVNCSYHRKEETFWAPLFVHSPSLPLFLHSLPLPFFPSIPPCSPFLSFS